MQHLDKNELISESQHGFRKGYSCASNLLVVLETVTAELNAKHNVDTIYLDLAKAFDKVPHQQLMLKLKAHGIDGLVGNWIKSWLSVVKSGHRHRYRPPRWPAATVPHRHRGVRGS